MFTNSGMSGRLAEEHCRDLLREAEHERLATQSCGDQQTMFMQIRLRASALLLTLGRLLQPREPRPSRAARAPQALI